jgi:hypothetical protein
MAKKNTSEACVLAADAEAHSAAVASNSDWSTVLS